MENQPQQPKRTGATNGSGSFPPGASDHSTYTNYIPWEPTDAGDLPSNEREPEKRTAVHEERMEDALWTSPVPPIPPTGSGAPYSPYLRSRAETAYYLQPQRGPGPTTALVAQRTKTQQECPKCGAMQPTSTSVCMECGAFFPAVKSRLIRCRRCGIQASANLSLCPGCGRVLEAASPRFTNWIVPLLLVVLFLLLIQQWQQGTSLSWVGRQISAGQAWVSELSTRLDPQITVSTLPAAGAANQTAASVADAAGDGTAADRTTTGNSLFALAPMLEPTIADVRALADSESVDNGDSADAVAQDVVTVLTATVTTRSVVTPPAITPEAAVAVAQVEPTATALIPTATVPQPTATATDLPSPTASPTTSPTASPTPSPTAVATATNAPSPAVPSPTVTRVRLLADGSTSAVSAAGAGAEAGSGASILRPTATPVVTATETATVLPTSTATSTPSPVPTATATAAAARVYVIKAGDTPSSIAAIYDISINQLLAANGLGLDDARRLRVGQELVIPGPGQPLPTATLSPTPSTSPSTGSTPATATAVPPTATSATPATAIRLDAPQLRSPESGTFLSCGGDNALIWLPVSFIREADSYLLHLGFVNGYNTDGSELIVWVLEQQMLANVTIWKMDETLCSLAPQEFGRQWRWYVEVIETTGNGRQSVSQPSAIWGFSWN